MPLLPQLAKIGTLRPYIRGWVARGYSANRIQGLAREMGLGIRRQVLLNIMREDREAQAAPRRFSSIRPDFRPSEAFYDEATRPQLERYATRFFYRIQLEGQEAVIRGSLTVHHAERLTRGALEGIARGLLTRRERYGNVRIHELSFIAGSVDNAA